MTDLLHSPLASLCEKLRTKELSAVELMQATLARIDETHERINAFVALRDPEAVLADAKAADLRIAEGRARLLEDRKSVV